MQGQIQPTQGNNMWTDKVFKTRKAMQAWLAKHSHKVQWQEIYVNNAYAVLYRHLRVID